MSADADSLKVLKWAGLVEGENVEVKLTYPEEEDAKYMNVRLYKNSTLNCARSLEHNLVIRAVIRNSGSSDSKSTNEGAEASEVQIAIKFPSPSDIFDKVWKLIPDYLKTRITGWAKDNQSGEIAREITEYVKTALGLLPIPVPGIFINSVANVVIPPLVKYLINKLKGQGSLALAHASLHFGLGYSTTPEIHKVMGKIDAQILRLAGLPASDLPHHLKLHAGQSNDVPYACLGQPGDRETRLEIKQFYRQDPPNGCKSLQLAQVVAAQISTNPACDQEPTTFGQVVWKSLTDDQRKTLTDFAQQDPPARGSIAKLLYTPVFTVLGKDPYNVPDQIQPSFTSMKVPEVTEWVVNPRG